jgi:hypothetical protein
MKKYLEIEIKEGATRLPSGKNIFYECQICGGEVSSVPGYSEVCKCRNILIDPEAGRQAFNEITKIRVFEKNPCANQ